MVKLLNINNATVITWFIDFFKFKINIYNGWLWVVGYTFSFTRSFYKKKIFTFLIFFFSNLYRDILRV